MTVIRSFISATDAKICEVCKKAPPEITIENHPSRKGHVSLCRNCAADDLKGNPKLMASALVALVVRSGKGLQI